MQPNLTAASSAKRVVIVCGPGRSGTSSLAGSLSRMGVEVPGRSIQPNQTNPRGHYEPAWVVDLHNELLTAAGSRDFDASPAAFGRIAQACEAPEVRARVAEWLGAALVENDQVVLKDPRIAFFLDLWRDVCGDLGVEVGYVTMLRHPAEVSGSRNEAYYHVTDEEERRAGVIRQVAGWMNVALAVERATRGRARVFVRYEDLLADWRSQLTRVGETLDLQLDPPPSVRPHPIDEFIDPDLRRVTVSLDELSIPTALAEMAEEAWTAFGSLAESDDDVHEPFDRLQETYQCYFTDALSLTQQYRAAERNDVREATRVKVRAQTRKNVLARVEREAAQEQQAIADARLSARLKRLGRRRRSKATE